MKYLFSGDSITLGQQGVSYVKKALAGLPGAEITNIACNGESLNMISRRLLRHLEKNPGYDVIVLAGGLADAAFEVFLQRGPLFRFAWFVQKSLGMKPEPDPESFAGAYRKLIQEVKARSKAKIVLVSLNCAGEIPDTPPNRKRLAFNEQIRRIAREENMPLADAGKEVDAWLQGKKHSPYYLENFWKVSFTDKLFALSDGGCDWLSLRRKLHVTIDGIHLNSKGAELFASALRRTLASAGLV